MQFGTVIVTKDRNSCLERTVRALIGTELAQRPIVVLNNGSEFENPRDVLRENSFPAEYIDVGFNPGIVGSRILAHRVAVAKGWTYYCFLQDDFELKASKPWLADTLGFIERFQIDYCRLTIRESALGELEHWVKGHLRVATNATRWNCSHIQIPKPERVGKTDFAITDKHYGDWAHIMSLSTSTMLFGVTSTQLEGESVTELITNGDPLRAFHGALQCEFDIAVKHWIAYSLGLTSATGIVMEQYCWCGLFDHITGISAPGRRELPMTPDTHEKLKTGWVPG